MSGNTTLDFVTKALSLEADTGISCVGWGGIIIEHIIFTRIMLIFLPEIKQSNITYHLLPHVQQSLVLLLVGYFYTFYQVEDLI